MMLLLYIAAVIAGGQSHLGSVRAGGYGEPEAASVHGLEDAAPTGNAQARHRRRAITAGRAWQRDHSSPDMSLEEAQSLLEAEAEASGLEGDSLNSRAGWWSRRRWINWQPTHADHKQDKELKRIQEDSITLDKKIGVLNDHHELLELMVGETKTKIPANERYMESELKKTRKSWQDLANELRNQIKTKEGAGEEAHSLQMEHLQKTFKAVSSIFLYQKQKFKELVPKIKEGEKVLKEELSKQSSKVKEKMKAAKAALGKAAKKSKKATKMMKAKLEKEISKVTLKSNKKIKTMRKVISGQAQEAKKIVLKETKRTKETARQLKSTMEDVDKVEEKANKAYDKVEEEAVGRFMEMKTEIKSHTKTFTQGAMKQLGTMKQVLTEKGEEMAKEMVAIEDKNKEQAEKTMGKAREAIGSMDKNLKKQTKEYGTMLTDSGKEVNAGKQAMKTFSTDSKAKMEDINANLQKENKQMEAKSAAMNEQMQTDVNEMSSGVSAEFGNLEKNVEKSAEHQQGTLDSTSKDLKSELETVSAAASEGIGDLGKKLGALSDVQIEAFDDSNEWMGDLGGMVSEFGGELGSWEKESGTMLASTESDISKAVESNSDAINQFGGDLLGSLDSMDKKFSGEIAAAEADSQAAAAGAEHRMQQQTGAAEKQLDSTVGQENAAIQGLDNEAKAGYQLAADQNNANKQGAAVVGSKLMAVEERERANGQALHTAKGGMDASLVSQTVAFADKTRAATAAAAAALDGAMAFESRRLEGEVDGELAKASSSVDTAVTQLGGVESTVKHGLEDVAADGDAMEKRLKAMRVKAQNVNKAISDEFNNVQAALSSQKLKSSETDEELRAAFNDQKAKLEMLFNERISKMSAEDQALYQEKIKDRLAEVEKMMSDTSKSFEEKKAQLEAWGTEVGDVLADLESEAQISESELQAIHANMTLTESAVKREVDAAHNKISAEELLGHQTSEEQDAALEERAAEIRKAIERSGLELSGELSGEVNAILGNSNAKITEILKDEEMSDEEKKRRIAEIDAQTKSEVAKLSSTQVASEHALESFEETEGDFDGDVQQQMAELENVLKDGQMSYVKHMLQERQMLQDQANQMVGLMENLMAMMSHQQDSVGAELSAEEQEQKMQMEKLLLSMKSKGQQLGSTADEALLLAQQAQKRAQSTESITAAELTSLEDRIATTGSTIHKSNGNLRQRLADERHARREAQKTEKGYLTKSASTVIEQLDYISDILSQASAKSSSKQKELDQKVDYVRNSLKLRDSRSVTSRLSQLQLQELPMRSADRDRAVSAANGILQDAGTAEHELESIKARAEAGKSEHALLQQKMYSEAQAALARLQAQAPRSSLLESAALRSRVDSLGQRLAHEEKQVLQVEELNQGLRLQLLEKLHEGNPIARRRETAAVRAW